MRGARVYRGAWAVSAVVVAAACASGAERPELAPPTTPRTIELGWVERFPRGGLVFRVERLSITRRGWSLTAAVTNESTWTYTIERPHRRGESMFGLVLLETADPEQVRELTAGLRKAAPFLAPESVAPPVPRYLRPGRTWRGTLAGSTELRAGSVVRVHFGRFVSDRQPRFVAWVTDHSFRL